MNRILFYTIQTCLSESSRVWKSTPVCSNQRLACSDELKDIITISVFNAIKDSYKYKEGKVKLRKHNKKFSLP